MRLRCLAAATTLPFNRFVFTDFICRVYTFFCSDHFPHTHTRYGCASHVSRTKSHLTCSVNLSELKTKEPMRALKTTTFMHIVHGWGTQDCLIRARNNSANIWAIEFIKALSVAHMSEQYNNNINTRAQMQLHQQAAYLNLHLFDWVESIFCHQSMESLSEVPAHPIKQCKMEFF